MNNNSIWTYRAAERLMMYCPEGRQSNSRSQVSLTENPGITRETNNNAELTQIYSLPCLALNFISDNTDLHCTLCSCQLYLLKKKDDIM